MKNKHEVIVVGGGAAGIMVSAQLLKKDPNLKLAIVEPSKDHYYQAAWTLVGAGTYDFDDTRRSEKHLITSEAKWIKEYTSKFNPEDNNLELKNGSILNYDFLVVCPGIQIDLNGIEGLEEAIGQGNVCSNYVNPDYTWEVIQNFKKGNAVFTQPATPIKCGGAPQKTMYLASDYWTKKGRLNDINVIYPTPGSVICGVKDFVPALQEALSKYRVQTRFFYKLTKIDPEKKELHYTYTKANENQYIVNEDKDIKEQLVGEANIIMPYDMVHLAPPQSAPDFIKESPLAVEGNPLGWIDVNKFTMQHNKYANIFALGDAANLPTAKTGAAARKQAPVVVENILNLKKYNALSEASYSGYSSCPIVTGYGKMLLAEFKYDNVRDSDPFLSKFVDTTKSNYPMWLLKKYGLPYLYWNQMMKGKM